MDSRNEEYDVIRANAKLDITDAFLDGGGGGGIARKKFLDEK